MNTETFPAIGKRVTFIAVRDGQVHVLEATTETHGDTSLGLTLSDAVPLAEGALVSLNYQMDGNQWRAKGIVDHVDGASVSLTLRGAPSRGESRDFIRAQLEMPTIFSKMAARDQASAAGEIDHFFPSSDDAGWTERSVNLSGNGIAFEWDTPLKKGDYVAAALLLQRNSGDEIILAAGKVVRVKPATGFSEVALFFEGLSDENQDTLFDFVSTWYHAQIHLALSSLTGGGGLGG